MSDLDIDQLSSRYGYSFTDIELVVGGVNRTYRVAAGDIVFYLRLYRSFGRPVSQITAEINLLIRFPQNECVSVSRPVATTNGEYVVKLDWDGGLRHACLFEGAEGEQFELENAAHIERFGASIAQLHLAMPDVIAGEIRELNPIAIVHDALQALREVPQSSAILEAVADVYLPSLLHLDMRSLNWGICHGDPWTGNARIHKGRTVFFDFDDFGRGPLVLDLSTAVRHFWHQQSAHSDAMMKALIAGYSEVRPLSAPELEALPHFIKLDEVRSLLFLARYCTLSDEVWAQVFDGALAVLLRPHRHGCV